MDVYQGKTKYRNKDVALRYDTERFTQSVARKEQRMVMQLLDLCQGVVRSLDVPSGTGRLTGLLPGSAVATDVSREMVQRVGAAADYHLQGDAERLPFADASFELAMCVRLLQHLPDEYTLARVLGELARVSSRYLLVSYFDSFSWQQARRWLRGKLKGRVSGRRAWRWKQMRDIMRGLGWQLSARRCSAPFLSEQWFVLFEKQS